MTNTTILPFSVVTMNINKKSQSLFSHFVHNSLPDIVNDCEQQIHRRVLKSTDDDMKVTCKQIAHSLRRVADQVDKKYCQDNDFNRNLQYLSLRLVLHSIHIRRILWTRSLLPLILLLCKTKSFYY